MYRFERIHTGIRVCCARAVDAACDADDRWSVAIPPRSCRLYMYLYLYFYLFVYRDRVRPGEATLSGLSAQPGRVEVE